MLKMFKLLLVLCILGSSFIPLSSFAASNYKIWAAPNTVKILKEQAVTTNIQTSVKIKMAKNEYESGQVIVSAGTTAINSLTASISSLSSGSNAIPTSDIMIYVQHYIEVTQPTTEHFTAGFYPDGMIPYQNYIQKNSKISVQAGKNQGLWFTFKTGKQTIAGTYTGNITLVVDGITSTVPVEVKVWDFSLTDESHSQSSYLIWGDGGTNPNMLLEGHPGIVYDTPQYWTLMENYYYFLLNYRITPQNLPISHQNLDLFIQNAAKYVHDDRVSAFSIPYEKGDFDNGKASQMVQGLRNAGLLNSKAYYYLGAEIDEPWPDKYPTVIDFCNKVKALDPNLKNVVTVDMVNELIGNVNTFCPGYTDFISDYYKKLAGQRLSAGDHLWWYGCVSPNHPYPTYHIDDYLISPRVVSWMQKSLGIQGNLYWGVNIYDKYDGEKYIKRDIWNDPKAFPLANGDGFLLYPGTDYGINGPIGTVRTEAIRDGNEDYEYLWTLEQKISAVSASLGVNVKLSDVMAPLYKRVFNNINDYSKDPEVLASVRDEVASMIESLSKNPKALIVFGTANIINREKEIIVYAEQGTTVKINGTTLSASGSVGSANKFSTYLDSLPGLNQVAIEYSKNGTTCSLVKKYIWDYKTTTVINDFESQADLNSITLQNGLTVSMSNQYVLQGNDSMKTVIPANMQFPGFTVPVSQGSRIINNWTTLNLAVYNTNLDYYNLPIAVNAKFSNSKGQVYDTKIGDVRALEPADISYHLSNIPTSFDISCISSITFWFWGGNSTPTELYIDKLSFVNSSFYNVNSFESPGDIQKASGENGASLSLSNEGVTDRSHAMSLAIPASNQFPGFRMNFESGFKDINKFTSLEIDVYNNSSTIQEFFAKTFNDSGQIYDIKIADLAPGKTTHVSYQLDSMPAQFDKSCISSILFWLWGGTSQSTNMYIDNFGFQVRNPVIINDFETSVEIQKFYVENGVALSLSNQHTTMGSGAMKAVLPPQTQFPGFSTTMTGSVKNFKKYSRIEMDIFNEGSTNQELYGKFFNESGQSYDVKIADLATGKSNHVVYNFTGFPSNFNSEAISSILFWTWGGNGDAINFYVDSFMLE